jgi:hypothetical protein
MAESSVANRFKMLEYYRVCSAFESVCALPAAMIWGFKPFLLNGFTITQA